MEIVDKIVKGWFFIYRRATISTQLLLTDGGQNRQFRAVDNFNTSKTSFRAMAHEALKTANWQVHVRIKTATFEAPDFHWTIRAP